MKCKHFGCDQDATRGIYCQLHYTENNIRLNTKGRTISRRTPAKFNEEAEFGKKKNGITKQSNRDKGNKE